jgi:hypothetical protein
MARARDRQMWNHTSALLAIVWNTRLARKGSRPARPEQFHPYLRGRGSTGGGVPLTRGTLQSFATALGAEVATIDWSRPAFPR